MQANNALSMQLRRGRLPPDVPRLGAGGGVCVCVAGRGLHLKKTCVEVWQKSRKMRMSPAHRAAAQLLAITAARRRWVPCTMPWPGACCQRRVRQPPRPPALPLRPGVCDARAFSGLGALAAGGAPRLRQRHGRAGCAHARGGRCQVPGRTCGGGVRVCTRPHRWPTHAQHVRHSPPCHIATRILVAAG